MRSDIQLGDSVAATLEKSEWGRQSWDAGPRGRERSSDRGRAHTVRRRFRPKSTDTLDGQGSGHHGGWRGGRFQGCPGSGSEGRHMRWHSSAAAVQRKGRAFQRNFLVFNVFACVLLGVLFV